MIAGSWRGVVQVEDADAYASYVRDTGFTEYAETLWLRPPQEPPRTSHLYQPRLWCWLVD